MAIEVKYRVKEVAADFGISPKEISDIVGKYYEKPRSNTQVLTVDELNAVFEHITRNNQISDISQVFNVKPKEQDAPKAEAPKQEAPKQDAPKQPAQQNQNRPAQQNQNRGYPPRVLTGFKMKLGKHVAAGVMSFWLRIRVSVVT